MQNLKKTLIFVPKTTRIWWILTWALKILIIFTLTGSFCAKYITYSLKNFKGIIDKRNTANFHQSTWKISKLGFWCDPFIQSRKCMILKFTEELRVMKMKNDAKLEEELTCRFRIGMMNLTSFDPSTQKSQKFSL